MPNLSPNPAKNPHNISDRLRLNYLTNSSSVNDDGQDIVVGLSQTPKSLPPRYFYDDRGSELFEQICQLPEYYPTRTEATILEQYASEIAQATGNCELIELGSGSSTKTRLLLDAYQTIDRPLYYMPIDVSAGILETSATQLLQDYQNLKIRGQIGTYHQALTQLPTLVTEKRMIFFLGSTLGNFTPQACELFLQQISTVLQPEDYFLLGIDLQKSPEIITAAYNDSQEITAQFNLNMLSHLNHRFQGNFDLSLFKHEAIYNLEKHQIEMYLHCQQGHSVDLQQLDLTVDFVAGESILTEISRKFNLEQTKQYLAQLGLNPVQTWSDPQQWFGLILCQVTKP